MLEAPSSAGERYIACARVFDGAKHSMHAVVGTAGRGEDCVEGGESGLGAEFVDAVGRNPFAVQIEADVASDVCDGRVGREVGVEFRIEVADDRDAGGHDSEPYRVVPAGLVRLRSDPALTCRAMLYRPCIAFLRL